MLTTQSALDLKTLSMLVEEGKEECKWEATPEEEDAIMEEEPTMPKVITTKKQDTKEEGRVSSGSVQPHEKVVCH